MTRLEDLPDVFSVDLAAEVLDCDPRTVRAMIHRGELPAVRVGRLQRICKTHLLQYLGLSEPEPEDGPTLRLVDGEGP